MARRNPSTGTGGVLATRTVYYPDPLAPREPVRLTRAQLAIKRQRDREAYLAWKERQIELAARDREFRRFWITAGLVVGAGVLGAAGFTAWWLWHCITTATFHPGAGWAVLALVVVAVGAKVGHRCVTTITHSH